MSIKIGFALAVVALLTGCGGGGPNAGTCYGSAYECGTSGAGTPSNNTTQQVSIPTVCGYQAGNQTITGTVVKVYDGDTITIQDVSGANHSIRLDSIDAPELAQTYGKDSQAQLESMVINQPVTVAYSKTDKYDRIVGTVFNSSCEYINLTQVQTGAAWFYKAYQCEISADTRVKFIDAQNQAAANRIGLWLESDPEAPWFYRNGTEPETPTCTSDYPKWVVDAGLTSGTTTPVPPTTNTGGSTCYVGPRGGTYTITASGNKNYGGC